MKISLPTWNCVLDSSLMALNISIHHCFCDHICGCMEIPKSSSVAEIRMKISSLAVVYLILSLFRRHRIPLLILMTKPKEQSRMPKAGQHH